MVRKACIVNKGNILPGGNVLNLLFKFSISVLIAHKGHSL